RSPASGSPPWWASKQEEAATSSDRHAGRSLGASEMVAAGLRSRLGGGASGHLLSRPAGAVSCADPAGAAGASAGPAPLARLVRLERVSQILLSFAAWTGPWMMRGCRGMI